MATATPGYITPSSQSVATAASLDPAATFGGVSIAQGPQEQFREKQLALTQKLYDVATGVAPSAAEMQFERSADSNLANTVAAANSIRGGSVGLRQRQLGQNLSQQQHDTALSAAILRASEAGNAMTQLGQVSAKCIHGVQDVDEIRGGVRPERVLELAKQM